jgi:TRAP-type mannitol/chloroaromatic compound transport system permease small subunit
MKAGARTLPTVVLGSGIALIVAAVFWSLNVFAQVGQSIIAKGFRPVHLVTCLYGAGTRCDLLTEAAVKRGVTPYSPLLFWAGILLIAVAIVLLLRLPPRRPGENRLVPLTLAADRISTVIGQLFAWSILVLTFAVSYEVFSRYALGAPTTWAFDASYILYGILFILAGPYALARNGHVRGDFLYRSWSPRRQAGIDLVLYFLFFFPGVIAFIYSGYGFAAQSWMTHEHSAYSPEGPPIYHYKTIIPVTGILLLVQGVAEVLRCIVCLKEGRWPRRLHDVEELEKVILEQHEAPKGVLS